MAMQVGDFVFKVLINKRFNFGQIKLGQFTDEGNGLLRLN